MPTPSAGLTATQVRWGSGDDKPMFRQVCLEGQPHVLEALSPPQTSGLSPSRLSKSPGGECSDKCSRKTLFYLITGSTSPSTLTVTSAAAKSSAGSPASADWGCSRGSLFSVVREDVNARKPKLWNAVDKEICLAECDTDSYDRDLDLDPFGEDGSLWSFTSSTTSG